MQMVEHPAPHPPFSGTRQSFINRAAKKRGSGSTGDNKGKSPRLRSACPVCPPNAIPQGENGVYSVVSSSAKTTKCRNGHVFLVGVGSIPANQSYIISL